ncbi:MAG TPA: DUF2510 domain-containing protein [Propionicimonas sp.]|nr:DUF2510 domain-containing protein [Propionicimonas sp.]
MSNAGWYPDPGGQPGLYRYWTGSAWTAAVTPNPQATPPPTAPMGGPQGNPQGSPVYGQGASGYPQGGAGYPPGTQPRPRQAIGWWVAGGAAVLAVVLLIWFITQGGVGSVISGIPQQPSGTASANICPKPDSSESAPAPVQANDGRVHGGKISYPMLGSPWSEVTGDNRVPFGRDVASQTVMQEANYNGEGSSWVSSVLVGELVAGDGFFSPKEGSEIVMKCVVGVFYGDAVVTRTDTTSKELTVDGNDAWYLESHLTFDIPNLITKGETAIVVIVDTGADSSSLYYASIPDTADPSLMTDARNLVGQLTVQG